MFWEHMKKKTKEIRDVATVVEEVLALYIESPESYTKPWLNS